VFRPGSATADLHAPGNQRILAAVSTLSDVLPHVLRQRPPRSAQPAAGGSTHHRPVCHPSADGTLVQPENFDPTRFDPDRTAERPNEAYYPFGLGQRLCIGANLSLLEQQAVVATVAQRFDRELVSGYVLEPNYDIALRPRDGVPMMLTPR